MPEINNLYEVRNLTEELVSDLEKLFPPFIPQITEPERNIFFRAGEVSLVQRLRAVLKYQKMRNKGSESVSDLDRLAGL